MEELTFEGFKKALAIIKQEGFGFYTPIFHECGCHLTSQGIYYTCKFHGNELKKIYDEYLKPTKGKHKITEIYGVKVVTDDT